MFYGNREICIVHYKIRIFIGHGRPVEILYADDAWKSVREITARHHVVFKIHPPADWSLKFSSQRCGSTALQY